MQAPPPAEICERAKAAKFDERLALLGMLLDAISNELKKVSLAEQTLTETLNSLKNLRMELARPNTDAYVLLHKQIDILEKKLQTGKLSSTLSADAEYACRSAMAVLNNMAPILAEKVPATGEDAFKLLKVEFDKHTKALKNQAEDAGRQLSNVFLFCEEAFGDGQEMLILVTELTISYYGSRFISRYGCKEYFNHNKELLFYERQKEIIR